MVLTISREARRLAHAKIPMAPLCRDYSCFDQPRRACESRRPFGKCAGRLSRELDMKPGAVAIGGNIDITTAPRYSLRGHQLGYRPKCNSYDAWDLPVWEQYFRDLAVFGCNAIELIPPRSDDAASSPHFPKPPMEMMQGMSRLADEYGLDVWIWYPAMDRDYADGKTVEFALREWGEVF